MSHVQEVAVELQEDQCRCIFGFEETAVVRYNVTSSTEEPLWWDAGK